jgi:UDPglucose 6-dehydrogenase
MARETPMAPWDPVERKASVLEAVKGCDAASVVTERPELLDVDWAQAAGLMRSPLVFDGCNFLDSAALVRSGLVCMGVGRATVSPG